MALLAALGWPFRGGSAQDSVAKVADLHGDWYLYVEEEHKEKLAQWQRLPARGVIRVSVPSSQDYIVLTDSEDKVIEDRRCSEVSACGRPIFLPRAGKEAGVSTAGRILARVWQRLWEEPGRYSMHRSRDILDESESHLTEGVTLLREGSIELSTILQNLAKGRYSLYFQHDPGGSSSEEPFGPFVLDWDPSAPSAAAVRGLEPGLYEVGLLSRKEGDQALRKTGRPAWALLCSARDYSEATASFRQAVTVTRDWENSVSPETVQTFLRADLSELAETLCRPPK
jgi:hypothetical protein